MSADNAIPFRDHEPTIRATSSEVIFDGFVEPDPEVLHVLSEAEDIEHAAHTVLQIGSRAVRVANASTDTNVVERAFEQMTSTFDHRLKSNLKQVTETTDKLFQEGGVVDRALNDWRKDLEASLDDTFDPDSKKSVIAKVESVVGELAKIQRETLHRLVDPSDDASPLRRIQRDLSEVIKETGDGLAKQLGELSERIAVEQKAAEVYQLTTLKGATFEDIVHAALCEFAAQHGDTAEQTGKTTGVVGTNKGDEVVTLNLEDTGGSSARVAYEIKDMALSHAKVTSELDDAMANRCAGAAILVFAKQDQAPTSVPFAYCGNHATVVFDKDDPDHYVLRLAYMWGRWIARRAVSANPSDDLNVERVNALFDRIATALERVRTVKRGHTQSLKGIQLAGEHLTTMETEITDALDELRSELGE